MNHAYDLWIIMNIVINYSWVLGPYSDIALFAVTNKAVQNFSQSYCPLRQSGPDWTPEFIRRRLLQEFFQNTLRTNLQKTAKLLCLVTLNLVWRERLSIEGRQLFRTFKNTWRVGMNCIIEVQWLEGPSFEHHSYCFLKSSSYKKTMLHVAL